MSALHVEVVTPEKTVFSGAASEVRVPGFEGELGVLAGHASLLALLRAGVTTVVAEGGVTTRFVTGRGFIEAGAERVVVLTDSCEVANASGRAAAEKQLEDAERVLADSAEDSEERAAAEAAAELARARIEA